MTQIRCRCKEYLNSMSQIEQAQILAYTHGIRYTGKPFVYCPWCGQVLEEIVNIIGKEGK